MAQQIETLARFVAETTLEQVPAEVRTYAKLVALDTLGVILAGAQRPEVRELRARLSATAGTGATVFAPGWPTNDPRTAALLNGIAGRVPSSLQTPAAFRSSNSPKDARKIFARTFWACTFSTRRATCIWSS